MISAAGSAAAGAWARFLLYLGEADLGEAELGEDPSEKEAQASNSSRARIGERRIGGRECVLFADTGSPLREGIRCYFTEQLRVFLSFV